MSDAADSWTEYDRLSGPKKYNPGDYDAVDNPTGFNRDGHPINLPRIGADVAAVGKEVADNAAIAAAAASQSGAWVTEIAPVTFLTATTLQVTGVDRTGLAKTTRPIFVRLSSGVAYGAVVSAAFAGGNTTLTVAMKEGKALDNTLAELNWGQDPDNAPLAQNSKRLAIIFG